ncbi:FMN phosphatase YigB (HAD superfamily) [Microbacterium halimionae]|uniref:FMN phosphatase YigB (HAD superfamily) n=1 Tax=Microbacterium halimionae TaxID=1526413 RepID=A0A7W3JRB7_9MICO|nr:HAD family hydrolase [Microbacterium halimionae]MBA8817584.1 FMN phosphatase YigB (HAD superfamily) [Microbacterium halimionae]NII94294.1 FMN phosphatase YigB (HAD superfamily) [Microbacterium halimionae]
MTPTIVFDFDGTLAVGPGPILAYAKLIAPAAGADFFDRARTSLLAFESGASEYRDGYAIIGALADSDGVDPEITQAAYYASRKLLGTDQAPVSTMPELADFLQELRAHARIVLATNAPADGIDAVLTSWGVDDLFDEMRFTIGKPDGLIALVTEALAAGPVLAIGDIAEFDLAPAAELGADTALVGATAHTSPAVVTLRGRFISDLRSDIHTWAATAASHNTASPDASSSLER